MQETILTFRKPHILGHVPYTFFLDNTKAIACTFDSETCRHCQHPRLIRGGEKWRVALDLKMPEDKPPYYIAHRIRRMPMERQLFDGEFGMMPVGGCGEVGRNCYAYFDQNRMEALLVDCGAKITPRGKVRLNLDCLTPYSVKGIILTHAHQDHLDLETLIELCERHPDLTLFGTATTFAFLDLWLRNANTELSIRRQILTDSTEEIEVSPQLSFVARAVDHSVPGSLVLFPRTGPVRWAHLVDFRYSASHAPEQKHFIEVLEQGWRLRSEYLVIDCLRAEKCQSFSKAVVHQELQRAIEQAPGRVFVTMIASDLERIASVLEAIRNSPDPRVGFGGFLGAAMQNSNLLGQQLNWWNSPEITPDTSKPVFLIAGSQGEADSAMITHLEDAQEGDTMIFSSPAIPGNEAVIATLAQAYLELGCRVIVSETIPDTIPGDRMCVHTSGHESMPGLIQIIRRLKPLSVIPCHGTIQHERVFSASLRRIRSAPIAPIVISGFNAEPIFCA